MSTKKTNLSVLGMAAMALMLLSAMPVSALSLGASASASLHSSTTVPVVGSAAAARLQTLITKGDSDIAARVDALNQLTARVQALKNVSADEKTSLAATASSNIDGLTALKTKLDADTDMATAHTDAASIFGTFRIYALVIPQGWILAAGDRVTTIAGLMTSMSANIQTRITADQSAGSDVTALTAALADMTAKISDAKSQSATAQAGVTGLVPDQGDKTKAAANHTALVAARANIKTATSDLAAARKDITTLLDGLKALGGSGSVSASGGTTTQ